MTNSHISKSPAIGYTKNRPAYNVIYNLPAFYVTNEDFYITIHEYHLKLHNQIIIWLNIRQSYVLRLR